MHERINPTKNALFKRKKTEIFSGSKFWRWRDSISELLIGEELQIFLFKYLFMGYIFFEKCVAVF